MYINYYLVKRGIDSKRLQYEGYGRSRPVVRQEKSMADENKNRRVEIRIIEK
jgi:outer membrane protein OmpA-like peptidoglycan-associated protein